MSRLSIFPEQPPTEDDQSLKPILVSQDPTVIQAELADRGIDFEQWPAPRDLPTGATAEAIVAAYQDDVERIQARWDFPLVDAIRITPEQSDPALLRRQFLAEHTHAEDELRFVVEGRGLFCLHVKDEVLATLCERGDLIRVPADTRHWFDVGSLPLFCALRFFNNNQGWLAHYTNDPIAQRFPGLDGGKLEP